jgi:hypothetical protein
VTATTQGVQIEDVTRNPDDENEVVIRFSYATEIGTVRLSVNDDGLVLTVNEKLTLTGYEAVSDVPIEHAEDDDGHGWTRIELSSTA